MRVTLNRSQLMDIVNNSGKQVQVAGRLEGDFIRIERVYVSNSPLDYITQSVEIMRSRSQGLLVSDVEYREDLASLSFEGPKQRINWTLDMKKIYDKT